MKPAKRSTRRAKSDPWFEARKRDLETMPADLRELVLALHVLPPAKRRMFERAANVIGEPELRGFGTLLVKVATTMPNGAAV